MSFWKSHFNHQAETIGAAKVPKAVGDRYWGQDLMRDNRYLQGLAGRLFLQSFGVNSALISGGVVTQGSNYHAVNITAAVGIADFDVDVPNDSLGWAVPAPIQTSQIPVRIESTAQTDFDISGATLDGVTTNYLKLRYAEANTQSRVKEFASGSYYYSISESFVLAADSSAPTTKDVVLATFIGNGTSTLTITQRYPIGPAGYLMTQCAILGMTYDGSDAFLAERIDIATRLDVGDTVPSIITKTPVSISASRTSANPTAPKYGPFIPRHDADHDISTSQVPQWVIDKLNAEKITFGAVSSFTATLSSGTLTFGAGTDNDKILALINELALVNRWYGSGEAANYGASGGLFTGSRQYCATINGVNYAIDGSVLLSRTMHLATAPADGTVTVEFGPSRVAGSTTSARLRRISGEALVAAGDVTGEVVVGGARTGKLLNHIQASATSWPLTFDSSGYTPGGTSSSTRRTVFIDVSGTGMDKNVSDGTNTVTTGKSNDPRTAGMAVYTHLAVVNATNWT